MKRPVLIILVLLMTVPQLRSQNRDEDGMLMQYIVDKNGDTVYLDSLEPIYKTAKRKGKSWRKYYRLVHNFAKAYPYALLAEEKLRDADSTIAVEGFNKRQKNRRNLTISQGKLLLRLIDRQTGITPYEIIKDYKGKAAAGFWQGIARLFGSDMKKPYDPDGEDKQTEELVTLYNKGEFNKTYRSIFGKNPPEPVVRSRLDIPQK